MHQKRLSKKNFKLKDFKLKNFDTKNLKPNFLRYILISFVLTQIIACASGGYMNTVEKLDLQKFMGDWYVVAGRTTFLEKGAYNSLEQYAWNEAKKRVDITFSFNKNSLNGPKKVIKQKAWIHNQETKAHWKVQPLWPLKLDYIIMEIDPNYQWTAVGVPNQNYLWIMSRSNNLDAKTLKEIIKILDDKKYNTKDIKLISHK